MIVDLIDFLKERLQTVRIFFYILVGVMLVWSIVGVDTHHAHTWAEAHIPAFWALFGILACVILIFFSRWFGRSGITAPEDYYDN